jgi:hypothetical protein
VPRKGTCDKIIANVQEVICAGNKKDGEAMLKLLAWQLQNVGKPSRVIVVMKTKKHQAGKGVLAGELMLKIYGPSGFLPSSVDQVLGRFNDSLRGRAYIFLDEVLFAAGRRTPSSAYPPRRSMASRRKIYRSSHARSPSICGSRPTTRSRPSLRNPTPAIGPWT